MLSAFASLVLSDVWPNMGIHDGDNKVVWTVGCCDGDLITVDFRDEVGDGNGGNGLLKIYNKTSGLTSSYYLGPFYGTWKAFGPYCAPQCPSENPNCHNLTFTSDANAHETTVTVTDSFGLIKGMGGMEDFPIAFSTIAPAKFCMAGQSEFDMARAQPPSQPRPARARARAPATAATAVPHAHAPPPAPPQPENLFFAKGQKQLGFRYQFYPREELEDQLIEPPQDVKIDGIPLTVWDNSDADALPPW